MPGQIPAGISLCQGTSASARESPMGAGGHWEPPLTRSASRSQCVPTPIQLSGQHPPGSDQLQGAVPLHLQVRDATRARRPPCHPLSPPAAPEGQWVLLGVLAAAGAVLRAALLSSLRSDMVSVLGSYYYDDGCESCGTDTFSREPFIVKFSSPTTREQSQCWELPGPGTGSPPRRAEPRAVPARRGVAPWSPAQGLHWSPSLLWGFLPPVHAQGSWVPAQHGRHCLLFPTMCHLPPSPITSHRLSSPTMRSLQLRDISRLQLFPIVSHIPSPATSHLVPYPTICFLQLGAISHHVPSPITSHFPPCAVSYPVPSPPPPKKLPRAHTLSHLSSTPVSFPKPRWLGKTDGKQAANPKPRAEGCSSPLEIPAWRTGRPQKANTPFLFGSFSRPVAGAWPGVVPWGSRSLPGCCTRAGG